MEERSIMLTLTVEQIRKYKIERYAMVRLISLSSKNPDEVDLVTAEMRSLEVELGSTEEQILQERAEGLRRLELGIPLAAIVHGQDIGAL